MGDFTFGDTFMDVMRPYIASHFERTHMKAIENYYDLFSPRPEGTKAQEDVFGYQFVERFNGEFSITPSRLKELAGLLEQDAIERRSVVVVDNTGQFAERLAEPDFPRLKLMGFNATLF